MEMPMVGGVELAIPIQAKVMILASSFIQLTIKAAGTGKIASEGPSCFFIKSSFLLFFLFPDIPG